MLLLFRCSTGEAWQEIMLSMIKHPDRRRLQSPLLALVEGI